jgi:hypothetical protein
MRNLELKANYLDERIFEEIRRYIESKEFQGDFPYGYWEEGSKASGKILSIKGYKTLNGYKDVTIKLRDDEDLNRSVVEKNMNKLLTHYQNIVKMIFSEK